ncbi:SGNH/GDSL hydrolase family protein [Actinoplanes sp. KI2]|uniref:SGNH/GDSL hydrolase family protein n=1 Tax=Actinoplanes sp. KI2 TaxID=2983315 RepID=UPI0021D58B1D|nr:SGNH/GDSL hydrolase family protein [Actinoplanes sp. KI2]MCU7728092.1 SGNH/GDSL hydrolase family protein [Actinoplanes sp. KI2]
MPKTSRIVNSILVGMLAAVAGLVLPGEASAAAGWAGAWSTSPQREAGPTFAAQTVRMLVHPTIGGSALRVRLSNTFGAADVAFGAVGVARAVASGAADLVAGTQRRVTFHGRGAVTVRKGESVVSDPVPLAVAYGQDLAVDVYVTSGGDAAAITGHDAAQGTQFVAAGNQAGAGSAAFTGYVGSWFWLDGVDVRPGPGARGSIVALGDSITDGAYTTWNGNDRWTDVLGARLGGRYGVLNQGIGGNQVLTDRTDCCGAGTSISGLKREKADVREQTGARYLILADGINDIGYHATAPDLIAGLRTIAERAHRAGIRVIGATITPYGCDSGCFTAEQEATRQAVNAWVRSTPVFDGVADFDAAIRDPQLPSQVLPAYQADHLHPNIAGQRAMAESIDLSLFC